MRIGPYFRTVLSDTPILILVDADKLSHKEIARRLEITEDAVDNAIRRRRKFPEIYLVARGATLRNVTGNTTRQNE